MNEQPTTTQSNVPDPQKQEQARRYSRIQRRLMLVNLLIVTIYCLAWLVFGWSAGLGRALDGLNPWLILTIYLAFFGGAFYILNLPLSWYESFILPHRFGLSNQTVKGWWIDQAKGLLVGGGIGLVVMQLIYATLRQFPQTWWLWAAGLLVIFNVVLAALAPVLLFPIFNKFVPLAEGHEELVERLKRLAERAGARVEGVYQFDLSRRTKTANAAIAGMGKTRRIILGDTLIKEFTPDEVEIVLAHELGHHVHKDIPLNIVIGSVLTAGGMYLAALVLNWGVKSFGFAAPGDVAAFPLFLLILMAYQLVTMPPTNAFSRWRERMADGYALSTTGKPAAFVSAFVRLADQNLSEVDPEPWVEFLLYSHPALGKRIAMAQELKSGSG